MMGFAIVVFAFFVLYAINSMTDKLCIKRNIPLEKQQFVFRTINILITILLTSAYISILFT